MVSQVEDAHLLRPSQSGRRCCGSQQVGAVMASRPDCAQRSHTPLVTSDSKADSLPTCGRDRGW
jgi:hypothetical protein